jgi:hypothetical protein
MLRRYDTAAIYDLLRRVEARGSSDDDVAYLCAALRHYHATYRELYEDWSQLEEIAREFVAVTSDPLGRMRELLNR